MKPIQNHKKSREYKPVKKNIKNSAFRRIRVCSAKAYVNLLLAVPNAMYGHSSYCTEWL
jgi:hypothetical protein